MAEALNGKVALITGGASGIGQACALRFAREGADIVIADLQPGDDTLARVRDTGRRAIYVRTDVSLAADCDAMVAQAVAAFGRVDVGVAAAGIATAAGSGSSEVRELESDVNHVVNLDTAAFTRVLDINLTGVMLTDRALARQMLAQGTGGSIVNIASTAAKIPLAGAAPYCVSKAGVWMLTKVLGLELAERGVRVNAVGPGFTSTPMTTDIEASNESYSFAMGLTPMKRFGRPEEIAAACLFLASDEASYFTGQMIHPAGGQFTD